MKSIAVFLIICLVLAGNTALSQTKNRLTVSYSGNTSDSYQIDLDSGQTHLLVQSHSWIRDDFSRYNLIGYSIDGGEMIQIDRNPRGDFSVEIPMDRDHSVVFFAVVQHPLVPTGISHYSFDPKSPTRDEWFDEGTSTKIVFPGIIPVSDDTRQVLLRWVLDNSEVHLVKEGMPELSTSVFEMDDSHKVEFFSKTQYRVDIISDLGAPYGSGWYDKDSLASFGVKTDGVFGNTFEGWDGEGVELAENPAALVVDSPKRLTAKWSGNYQTIVASLIVGIVAISAIIYVKKAKAVKVRGSGQMPVFTSLSGASGQYDSEIAKFLEDKAIETLDSYLSKGIVDQERHSRLKSAVSKRQ